MIFRETQLSITMQLLVAVVLILHAIYSIILYLLGNKDRRLLFFSVLTISIMFYYLLGSDDKLLSFGFQSIMNGALNSFIFRWLALDIHCSNVLIHGYPPYPSC